MFSQTETEAEKNERLFKAAIEGHTENIMPSLQAGAHIDALSISDDTPLSLALNHGHYDVVRLLCEQKANVNQLNRDGLTPLTIAIFHLSDKSIIPYLLEQGATFNAPVFELAWKGELDALKTHEQIASARDENKRSVLHYAAAAGHAAILTYLVEEKGMDIKAADGSGNTAAVYAALNNHLDALQYINTLDPIKIDPHSISPIEIAAAKGHLAMIQWYIVHEASKHNDAIRLFRSAAAGGQIDTMKWLMDEYDLSPSVRSKRSTENYTPMLLAAYNGHLPAVQYLVEKRHVSLMEYSNDGQKTALLLAATQGHIDTVKWILSKKPSLISLRHGKAKITALHAALEGIQPEMACCLLDECGANIFEKDFHDRTPLQHAMDLDATTLIELLLKRGAGLKADISDIVTSSFPTPVNFNDMVLIGAKANNKRVTIPSAINTNNELKQAIDDKKSLDAQALYHAVTKQLTLHPFDEELKETRRIILREFPLAMHTKFSSLRTPSKKPNDEMAIDVAPKDTCSLQ